MEDDATVSAADIARLARVGRAAVSNWRRRYPDFPQPVGGTASSPLFALDAVTAWFRARGKKFELTAAERAWQRLRALGDDLELGVRVAEAGTFLAFQDGLADTFDAAVDDPELITLLSELARETGPADAFEVLCHRYFEAHSRRLSTTPEPIAALMSRLAGKPETVLDPACGFGTLALASGAREVLAQDSDPTTARIAALRLALRGISAEVQAVDALRDDAFAGRTADVVLCDPPFNERAWGHEELVGDDRWEYGLPPRGEPELAWVQHCLAHAASGGTVAILMPGAAAGRRSGKRIRGNLLRAGVLRAVVTLAPAGPDLWLLRRPAAGERTPSTVLLAESGPNLSTVDTQWREFRKAPETGARIIDLLDDDIDLTPARHRAGLPDPAREFLAAQEKFAALALEPPKLAEDGSEPGFTTIGELAKAGVVEVRHAPAKTTPGDEPLLTADDLAAGRGPTGSAGRDRAQVSAAEGDVVASVTGIARVHSGPEVRLGPALTRYRVDPARFDPEFLAGCLRAAELPAASGSTRIDVRRVRIPRYPLEIQRRYGRAFRQLADFADVLRAAAGTGHDLVRLGLAGLVTGRLAPGA